MSKKPCDPSKGPCKNVTKGGNKAETASFFQRIGKYIIFFAILAVVAAILTIISVSVAEMFSGSIPLYDGYIYFDLNVFLAFIIGIVVTPIIILYVMEQRKKTMGY